MQAEKSPFPGPAERAPAGYFAQGFLSLWAQVEAAAAWAPESLSGRDRAALDIIRRWVRVTPAALVDQVRQKSLF